MIAEIMRVDCPFMVPIMSNCIDHPCYADRARPADHGHRPHGERRGGSGGGGEESQSWFIFNHRSLKMTFFSSLAAVWLLDLLHSCCYTARRWRRQEITPLCRPILVSPLCFDYIKYSIPFIFTFCVVFLSLAYLLILHCWDGYRRGAKGNVGARISTRSDCPDGELHQLSSR